MVAPQVEQRNAFWPWNAYRLTRGTRLSTIDQLDNAMLLGLDLWWRRVPSHCCVMFGFAAS